MKRQTSSSQNVYKKNYFQKALYAEQYSYGPTLSPDINSWYKKHPKDQGVKVNRFQKD